MELTVTKRSRAEPIRFREKLQTDEDSMCSFESRWKLKLFERCFGPVAQLVRAPPCHGGGRGFESHPGRFIDS